MNVNLIRKLLVIRKPLVITLKAHIVVLAKMDILELGYLDSAKILV
jgi:hypothetical protein